MEISVKVNVNCVMYRSICLFKKTFLMYFFNLKWQVIGWTTCQSNIFRLKAACGTRGCVCLFVCELKLLSDRLLSWREEPRSSCARPEEWSTCWGPTAVSWSTPHPPSPLSSPPSIASWTTPLSCWRCLSAPLKIRGGGGAGRWTWSCRPPPPPRGQQQMVGKHLKGTEI